MENLNTTVAVEKSTRISLPEITPEQYKVLEYKGSNIPGATAAIITTSDINEYAQIASIVKTCEKVLYSSGNKTCTIVVDGSLERNANQVALLNPDLKGKVISIHITYNNAEKLRLSAKTTGTAKSKKTAKSAFFEADLANVVDYEGANYIYGKEGSDFSKETNTKIARVVKALLPFGILYSDEDKSGFHKGHTKIPVDVRVDDNYTFFFKWADILAKLQPDSIVNRIAENLIAKATPKDAQLSEEVIASIKAEAQVKASELAIKAEDVVADIIAIINFYYPNLTVDTTKELILECSKAAFATLKSEKLTFDKDTGTVISLKEIQEKIVAEKKAAKAAEREAKKAESKKAKAEAVKAETKEEVVAVENLGITPSTTETQISAAAVNVTPVATTIDSAANVTPVATTIDPATLLQGIIPNIN